MIKLIKKYFRIRKLMREYQLVIKNISISERYSYRAEIKYEIINKEGIIIQDEKYIVIESAENTITRENIIKKLRNYKKEYINAEYNNIDIQDLYKTKI